MTITAQVICDSTSPAGTRITTLQLRYPKFIHGEFMTHRAFSRNASSSRAIPVKRMIEDIQRDPAMPVFWGSNKPGMQAGEEVFDKETVRDLWLISRDEAISHVEELVDFGLHKQIANRILEPWCHINVVVTATDWSNFFALRRHKNAQPEMRVLADRIWEAMQVSVPTVVGTGSWHLPYITEEDFSLRKGDDLIVMSVARCARVSYMTHEMKKPTFSEDRKLYDRLVNAFPMHASPAEHQATPDDREITPSFWGNFHHWRQYRKTLLGESISEYPLNE